MGSKVSITVIISNIDIARAFEWYAKEINAERFSLSFILLNPGESSLESLLRRRNIPVFRIPFSGGKAAILPALYRTYFLLRSIRPDIVHAHLFEASLVGMLAAYFAGVQRRIHSRHHSDIHHIHHPKSQKYDRLINLLSTDILAASRVVMNILTEREHVPPEKIRLIPLGFPISEFETVPNARVIALKRKYRTAGKFPIVGVVSRYVPYKGIPHTIRSFKNLLGDYPNAYLMLANATGPSAQEIHRLLGNLPRGSYVEIPFESDNAALYQLFDVYVHVPISFECEAFGQTYIEALAAGIPSIFTQSGIINEFPEKNASALMVPFKNSEAITAAIKRLLLNKTLANRLIANGRQIARKFSLDAMLQKLERVYSGEE